MIQDFPQIECLSDSVKAAAKQFGLMRKVDQVHSTRMKSVFISFRQLGVPDLGRLSYFEEDENLDGVNAEIVAIDLVDINTNQRLPDNFPTAQVDSLPLTELAKFMFVACDQKNEIICSVPLTSLLPRINNGRKAYFKLNTQEWGNCYCELIDPTIGLSAAGLWFNVYYNDKKMT